LIVGHPHGAAGRWLGLPLPAGGRWSGRHFYVRAWAAVEACGADMNTLIALGTGAAFGFSVFVTIAARWVSARGVVPQVYYEAVAAIIALVLLGNLLEARAKVGPRVQSAGSSVSSHDSARDPAGCRDRSLDRGRSGR